MKRDGSKSSFLSRLDRVVGTTAAATAAAAGAGVVGTAETAEAALVVVTPGAPIVIPDNIDGLYMNVVTGQTSPPLAPGFAGYDINPYTATAGANTGFHLWGPTANTFYNPQGVVGGNYNLPFGTNISGAASAFFRPGGGTNVGLQMNLNSTQNCIGFRFANENNGGQIHFGWARLSFGAALGTRSIIEYAYDDVAGTPVQACIPEPTTLGLLALGAIGLVSRRRRS